MKNNQIRFVYGTEFTRITASQFRGWIIHLLCMEGECNFVYNHKYTRIGRNDALVLSRPDLVSDIACGDTLKVAFIAAPARFLYSLLPANHYGIGGGISLFDNPVMQLSEKEAAVLGNDLEQIRLRMDDGEHLFYNELIGSLALTMIYDLFDFHARLHSAASTGEQTATLVSRLVALLGSGSCRTERTVAYYADKLCVTPKYLSETVKRITGHSVMKLINQYTLPIVIEMLKHSDMSVAQISDELNFSSQPYFTRYVQKHLGMTPGEYRKSLLPTSE